MKRPLTIWFAQSLLLIFALLFLSVFLINLVALLGHREQDVSLIRTIVGYSVILGLVLLPLVAFIGLAKRAVYGRWLGVGSLTMLWGVLILSKVIRASGPYQYYDYDNNAQLAGAIMVQVLLHGLLLMLI